MRKIFVASLVLLFAASMVFAADFTPQVLNISGPDNVQYNFDGSTLELPVTVTAANAAVNLLIFTQGEGANIGTVQNGFLGWHYVNKIDTCLYISPAFQLTQGTTNITWDGMDENGNMVPSDTYGYYLWGFDNVGSKVRAAMIRATGRWINPPQMIEFGEDGNALAQPILWSKNEKWTLGLDPEDSTLVETCLIEHAGYGQGIFSCVQPDDHSFIYKEIGTTGQDGLGKWLWVPNGNAELQTDWADNGYAWVSSQFGGGNMTAGVATDGTYLYTHNGDHTIDFAESDAKIWDYDGTVVAKIDMSDWWSDPDNVDLGAQMNGGPNTVTGRPGKIYLNCHCSCMKQLVNPTAGVEDEADLLVWANGNGDGTMDNNGFDKPDSERPWACNDYWTGTYAWGYDGDNHGFAYGIAYNFGAVSFGLIGPDGTGMDYRSYAGETNGFKFEMYCCDNNSAYDGIYCDNVHIDYAFNDFATMGFWFVGQSSFYGTLSYIDAVADAAPAAFAVAQNSPNPFNPTTTISFTLTQSAKTTVDVYNVAGQKVDTLVNANLSAGSHSVTWNAAKFSAGVYFYTVKSGDFSKTMKMTLLK